ncbi:MULTISPECIES: MCE family protein [Mycobacteriaceae]|jgi:phospholipid/cholesterol/gamma-HCH transport system substrate-binding protein|uniref:Mammalian cell entry protein n=6 Tax=Mycobacteriaceae TaxID=1762 RepID=A0A132PEE5_9MYCO|nr:MULTISPECIES: MlaD family protein [Mycobacteriaceae]MBI5738645.1 MCE family protein [Mycolicibacterium neoaurum]MCF6390977.1 MCE family protein [Mycobacterium sp. MBM]MEE3066415.1 MlaD family protein [Actinomycetota bacterium]KLI04834.1 mammalian cell entry protein [Mycolicibacterium senegalense]KLO47492.1 mammalian cell entry protein [Mycolicibacterium senegalense]
MYLHKRVKVQLAILTVLAVVVISLMTLHVMKLPAKLFGVGRYTVTMELPQTGGLYATGNVTYRGTEVGRVQSVHLTDTGVAAVLSLKSGIDIPSDVKAEVHSQSAIGEQYVDLLPRSDTAPPLKNGDVIPLRDASVPPDINKLLTAVNTGLRAIPRDNLNTAVDEAYTAVGGLGPELARLVRASTRLSIDARANLDSLTSLIDQSQPVLDSQTDTSDAIQAWAANLATVTAELQTHDNAVAGIIDHGGPAAGEVRQLFERFQPTLPILLANLVSVGQVALTYRNDLEQLLVLLPQAAAIRGGSVVANANTKQDYRGEWISFNLNINLPPACTTGFLPTQQRRPPSFEDSPERPAGDVYCRVPQDSPFNVRGARNIPCETVPGKRAPTVRMCESDEQYVPLNDGFNWKGDPNATLSGQDIPQGAPGSPPTGAPPPAAVSPPPPPVAAAQYDPATGTYIGPDGQQYTQSDLAQTGPKEKTWQTMLTPPGS